MTLFAVRAARRIRQTGARLVALGPFPSASRMAWLLSSLAAGWRDDLEQELGERAGFQLAAVAFGAGCLAYFSLAREPLLWPLSFAAVAAGTVAVLLYRHGMSFRAVTILALVLAGVTTAKLRVESLSGPTIERLLSAELTGRVVAAETREGRRPRLVLDTLVSPTISPAAMPARIRLTTTAKAGLPRLGSRIAVKARLSPLPGPVTPGGYDPRRAAFFEGIGGSGFSLGAWTLAEAPGGFDPRLAVARLRAAAVKRVIAAESGEAGAVAAALLVGDRSAISETTNESMRLSGLAHILSISGLHMMLVAGAAFVLVRALLAASPALALQRDIRKGAAGVALAVVSAYFVLSGGGAATLRAYVMAAIMFAAILLDRPAISMRNLAIAAFAVLALEPESVAEPGFQMSFAAVAALIAGWQAWQERPRRKLADETPRPGLQVLRWVGKAVLGTIGTSLIAGLATAPFSAYHFERVAAYSLLGNLLAAPVVSAIIMPFGLLSLAAMPFGLDALPLWITARGIDVLLAISAWVASLPGAEFTGPAVPPASLLSIAAGLLWLCLWRRRWRLLGAAPIAIGAALIPLLADPPDILIAPEGQPLAVRDARGTLRVAGGRAGSYAVEQLFDKESARVADPAELGRGVRCDDVGCQLIAAGGMAVALVQDPSAFVEDCRRAAVIVTPLAAPRGCRARLIVDKARLAEAGAHAIRIRRGQSHGFDVTTERSRFPRPWQPSEPAGR